MMRWLQEPASKDFLQGFVVGWASALVIAVFAIIAHSAQ